MQKALSLSFCLLITLSLNSYAQYPKLYQSLWPDFCYEHLQDGDTCSEKDPCHAIDYENDWCYCPYDDEGNQDHTLCFPNIDTFFPFFSRIRVHHAHLSECQTLIPYLPELQKSCSYVLCDVCHKSVQKSIGIFNVEDGKDYIAMHHRCGNCLYSISEIIPHKNYSRREAPPWHTCQAPSLPFAYFNEFTSRYYPFLKHHLEFSTENPACRCYWPYTSGLACTISNLIYDQMHDLFQNTTLANLQNNPNDWVFNEYFPLEEWPELKMESLVRTLQDHFIFAFFYSNYHTVIVNLCNTIDKNSLTASRDLQKLYFALTSIRPLFLNLYSFCLEQHPHPKIFYERGMVHFHNGDLFAALLDMKMLTNSVDDQTLLSSGFYLQEGTSYAELGLYDEAIQALTKSIAKDSANKEAYFERASLYFETGNFECSIQDYLESGLKTTPIDSTDFSSITFAQHLISGITKGTGEAITDFLPSLMASVNGLSHGLWAFASNPQICSKEIVNSCKELLPFLSNNSSIKILESFIPEIKELNNNQSNDEKAHLLGLIIGKYGTEAFAPLGLVKAYKSIRSANRLLTLEQLAKTSKESRMLAEAATNWNKVHLDSIEKFRIGEKTLNSFKDRLLTETAIRKIIHETGFATFPRPKGIPHNFKVTFSDKGCGMKYIHPENPHEYIRVMPGKPHSIQAHQTKPYVVYQKHGKTFDKFGNIVNSASPEAHIPIEEFVYKGVSHETIKQ